MRRPNVVVTVHALHVRASAWLSLLRSAELEGMVRQRLIPRLLVDGCARMPAPLKNILSCGDPVCAQLIAPPQGSCHRACSTHYACECMALSAQQERGGRRYGVAETDIPRLAGGWARMPAAHKDILSCGDPQSVHE